MKTKRMEQIIREIRRRSNNIEWGANSGVSDDTISQILNGAKDRLQALILSTMDNTSFTQEFEFTTIGGQEKYELPAEMLDYDSIVTVDIKYGEIWAPLDGRILKEREAGYRGMPYSYIRDGRELLLRPIPQAPYTIRVTYNKRLNDLGTVLGTVLSTAAGQIVPTPIVYPLEGSVYAIETFSVYDVISFVESDGEIITSLDVEWDSVNNRFNLIDDITDHSELLNKKIVMGKNSSNYLMGVDPILSEYLIQYGADYLNLSDSNGDVNTTSARLSSLEEQIIGSYATENKDIILIADINKRGY